MNKRTLLPSLLILVIAAPVFAQGRRGADTGPGAVARRCAARTHVMADRTVQRIATRTHRCIRVINELLAQGSLEEARQAAHRCIAANAETANRGITRIGRLVTACTDTLVELEAPQEMIHAVHRAGQAARTFIQAAKNRATHAIEALQPD